GTGVKASGREEKAWGGGTKASTKGAGVSLMGAAASATGAGVSLMGAAASATGAGVSMTGAGASMTGASGSIRGDAVAADRITRKEVGISGPLGAMSFRPQSEFREISAAVTSVISGAEFTPSNVGPAT